jgi:hypothetical protein
MNNILLKRSRARLLPLLVVLLVLSVRSL